MNLAVLPDDAVLDNDQSASAPAPDSSATPAPVAAQPGQSDDDIRSHIHAILTSNADKDSKQRAITAYVQSYGGDPRLIGGMDASLKDPNIGIVVQHHKQPDAPSGLVELPDDVQLDHDNTAKSPLEYAGAGVRDVMQAGGDLANLVTTPIRAGLQAVGAPAIDYEKDAGSIADSLGLKQGDPVISAINKGGTEGLLTAGAATPLAGAGGAVGAAADALASQPVAAAASQAASAGAGEAAKQAGGGPVAQIAASLAGGGIPALATGGVNAVRGAFGERDPNEILAAFNRQNIDPMAAQVGGNGARIMSAGAKATLGGLPLADAAERTIEQAKAARNAIAAKMGNVLDDTGAGLAAQKGSNAFIDSTLSKADKLYNAIPINPSQSAVVTNTKKALTGLTQGLQSNPELSKIWTQNPRLQKTLDALTPETEPMMSGSPGGTRVKTIGTTITRPGTVSWQDLKHLRSIVGRIVGKPSLTSDGDEVEAMRSLYGALSEDMAATAKNGNALPQFQRANTYWRARQSRIENTLSQIIGKNLDQTGEGAFATINRWSREGGDSAAIARLMRSLPDDDASTVRASLFARMGNTPVTGHGEASVFSPSYFVKNWANIDHRAKQVLFPGTEYRQDLDDISKIAEAMKASEGFTNTSRTALATHIGGNLLGSAALAIIFHPVSAIGGEGIGYGAGKLLSSPRFARWLASSPNKPNPAAALAHVRRLTTIAGAEPAIANEVLNLQERLASAFTNSPAKLAAQEPDNESSGVDR